MVTSTEHEVVINRTWKPTTAGILSIIAGAFSLIAGIVVAAISGSCYTVPWYMWGAPPDANIAPILGLVGAALIILGIVSIVGGAFALQRRVWGLALAGAICAFITPPGTILGILSIIFVSMGKDEFAQRQ